MNYRETLRSRRMAFASLPTLALLLMTLAVSGCAGDDTATVATTGIADTESESTQAPTTVSSASSSTVSSVAPATTAGPVTTAAPSTTQPTQIATDTQGRPYDWVLASINASNPGLSEEDPSVAVFRDLILNLERKTANSQQEIADMSVKAWQIVGDEGYDDSLLFVMQELDRSIPDEMTGLDLADIGAAWLALRTNQ